MIQAFYQGITDFVFMEDQPRKADVIFMPGGNYREGAVRAAQLYKEGYAPYLLPSGKYSIVKGYFDGSYSTEWEYLRDILLQEGVSETAILKEDQATYTWENAILSRKVTDAAGLHVETALLVCKAYHARRAYMYYQEQFPQTRILVIPVTYKGITKENWYLDPERTDRVLGELVRCGKQFRCCLPPGAGRPLEE